MRAMLLVLAMCVGTISAQAKWILLNKPDLIKGADAIAVANYTGYTSVGWVDNIFNQQGTFKTIQTLKGENTPTYLVYGTDMVICAPVIAFRQMKPGQYIVFLKKTSYGWVEHNAGVFAITGDKVNWFKDDKGIDKSPQPLATVIADIQKHVK